jgi:predicted lipoprotein with Yx(FWY)xxD motif
MRKTMLAGGVLGLGVLLAACGGGGGDTSSSASTSQPAAGASAAPMSGSASASASAPVTVTVKKTSLGTILVDDKGMTLYLFEKDKNGKSACDGACAEGWPPLLTSGKAMAGSGLKPSLLGTTTRSDGTTQVTYGNWPLYYFAGDKAPGDTTGQDVDAFGAEWYVLDPNTGKKLEK